MAKDKGGHGSEKKGARRFQEGGHIIEHAVTPKTGEKMFVVGYTGNSYKNREDAIAFAKRYPTVAYRNKDGRKK